MIEIRDSDSDQLLLQVEPDALAGQALQGARLQLALAKPDNVAVRLNGNRVSLPVGTIFVVTPRRIVRATS